MGTTAPSQAPGENQYDYSVQLAGYYFGGNSNAADLQLIEDELSAVSSRSGSTPVDQGRAWDPNHPFAGLGQGSLAGIGTRDLQELLTAAENWSALVGWREFPTGPELLALYRSGQYTDPLAASTWLTGRSPQLAQQFPWAAQGVSKSTYDSQVAHQKLLFSQLTGSADGSEMVPSDMYWSVRNSWTEADWIQNLQNRPGMGYLKHGYTFNTWQEYKQQNRSAVISRYGRSAATSSNPYDINVTNTYLKNLEDPLPTFNATGSTTKFADVNTTERQSGSAVR